MKIISQKPQTRRRNFTARFVSSKINLKDVCVRCVLIVFGGGSGVDLRQPVDDALGSQRLLPIIVCQPGHILFSEARSLLYRSRF